MSDFSELKPYEDEEVRDVVDRLVGDDDLIDFLARYDSPRLSRLLPSLVRKIARRKVQRMLGDVVSIRTFQDVVADYVRRIVDETMTSFEYRGVEKLRADEGYVFVSNHRDIAGDSMLVNYALYLSGLDTVRIAVGDNLVQRPFATDIMRLNKSFFINRTGDNARKVYAALLDASTYIHESIEEGQSIWIAQAEGRAKDGMDLTDPAVVKMLALAHRKESTAEVVRRLRLVPVSLSYEYDPCDVLKAEELASVESTGAYLKPPGADLVSLARGLGGFKGRVVLSFGEPMTGEFDSPEEVAKELDQRILSGLRLFPVNLLALRELADRYREDRYTKAWQTVSGGLDALPDDDFYSHLVECPDSFQRQWLRMYANPVVNKLDHNLELGQIGGQLP